MPDIVIISTGEELLYGTTINTNSAFISRLFSGSNFKVLKHETVGDSIDLISECIKKSLEIADIVITTGGLGPTDDDNTVEAVCRVLNLKPLIHEDSLKKIEDYFRSIKFNLNRLDTKMASVPENTQVIINQAGLAPGFLALTHDKLIISLPGVPEEVEAMMTLDVIPYLKRKYNFKDNIILQYKMSGIRESDINTIFHDMALPDTYRIGITSRYGVCDLTVTCIDDQFHQKEITDKRIREKFNRFLLEHDAVSPEQELVYLLKNKCLTISTAESCTGGLIAKKITDVAGSSEVYKGSVVAYSNDIKINFLNVPEKTLEIYGAVSENTAVEMATAIQTMFDTDISIATTGIAGPGGGSDLKPAGTVCFAFRLKKDLHTTTRFFNGTRDRIRIFSSLYAINFIRNCLKKNSFF